MIYFRIQKESSHGGFDAISKKALWIYGVHWGQPEPLLNTEVNALGRFHVVHG
jgi:hypothetical protein